MTLFWFIILLSPLVFFHELAHFTVAKLFNVKVLKFSLGFGPALLKKKWGETTYVIAAIPLGGYVSMIGEDPNEKLSKEDEKRTLSSLKYWKKMSVVLAGPFINFVIPIFIFFFYNLTINEVSPPEMGTVIPNMAAYNAGLKSGDRVISIDGDEINSFNQFRRVVQNAPGKSLNLVVNRPGEGKVNVTLVPKSYVGKNSVGLKARIGRAGVLLNGTIATIGIIDSDSIPFKKGLRTGDRITGISIDNKMYPIKFWSDYSPLLKKHKGTNSPVMLYVLSPKEELNEKIGLFMGNMKTITFDKIADLKSIERGEFYVASTSKEGVFSRWGIHEGDRLWSIRKMKTDENPGDCSPEPKSDSSLSKMEDVILRNPTNRLCVSWVSPSPAGSCFHSAVVKQDRLSSVDEIGNRVTKYSMGFATWRALDVPDNIPVKNKFLFSLNESLVSTWEITRGMVQGIYYMITGELKRDNVGSVVMIAQMAQLAADRGAIFFLQIMALISLNLGLLNLLPIPILDGGHALLFTIEAVQRKPITEKVRAIISWIGLLFILFLMVFGFKNDLVRLFRDKETTPKREKSLTVDGKTGGDLSPLPKGVLPCIKPGVEK